MIRSMTGFASGSGTHGAFGWSTEIRAVNGKGLDIRVRGPDWVEGLEAGLRKQVASVANRGNVTVSLRLSREDTGGTLAVNSAQLEAVLVALQQIEDRAMEAGLSLAPSRATDLAGMRGVLEQANPTEEVEGLDRALLDHFGETLAAFDAMRQAEGAALEALLRGQIDEIEALTAEAVTAAKARTAQIGETLRRNLAKVMDNADGADPDRVAQELALIAVKSDVTEETDRLSAHVAAARALIDEGGAVGRRLDFLMQEFNREANTLCSKAQNTDVTRVGLALKAVIDQMREQVQNVE